MSKEIARIIKKKMSKEQIQEFVCALKQMNGKHLGKRINGKSLWNVFYQNVGMLISYKYKHLFTDEELQMIIEYKFKK